MASRRWCQSVPTSARSAVTKSGFDASAATTGPLRVFELLDDVEDHLPLASGQVQALVGDRADRLVLEDTHRVFVEQGRLPGRVEKVRGVHAEDVSEGNHLVHGGVGEVSGPELLDVFLAEVTKAHARHLGVGERQARLLVSDHVEQTVRSVGDAAIPAQVLQRCSRAEIRRLLEPQLRRETHDLRFGPQLLEPGVFDTPPLSARISARSASGAFTSARRALVEYTIP